MTFERANVEEQYTAAGNTSNLTVEAASRGAGDLLIAAGWSASRFGMLLLRLHSEWDGAEKPKRPTEEAIRALALTSHPPSTKPGPRLVGPIGMRLATIAANEWYIHEAKILMGKLKTLPQARYQLGLKAIDYRMQSPESRAAGVIHYWLDQNCHECAGLKFKSVQGTPALSGKLCRPCEGSGIAKAPYAHDGKRLANYMDKCVEAARTSIKNRLH